MFNSSYRLAAKLSLEGGRETGPQVVAISRQKEAMVEGKEGGVSAREAREHSSLVLAALGNKLR